MWRSCAARDERFEVVERAVARMHVQVIGDVVPVVAQRGREEGQQPEAGDAEPLQVIELLRQSPEVADAVVVAVEKGPDVRLVDDRVLVPERIVFRSRCRPSALDAHRFRGIGRRRIGLHAVFGSDRCAAGRGAAA